MSSETDILLQLKGQLVAFLDELIESFPAEPDFVIFRIFINDQVPIIDIMEYIVTELCPHQEMVKNRNDAFFLNNNLFFEKLDEKKTSKVNHFKKLWQSSSLDKEDRETIWRWFASFIYLGNKYKEIHKN
jgi:hypothetical protein